MKIQREKAILVYEAIHRLYDDKDITLPVKTQFQLIRNAKSIEPFYIEFFQGREALAKAYSNEEGKVYEDKIDQVNEQVQAMLDEYIEVWLQPIAISDLEDSGIKIKDLDALYPLILVEGAN